MFALISTTVLCVVLLILSVHAVFDLHDSVVIQKQYAPEAKVSRTAELAYNIVESLKDIQRSIHGTIEQ